MKIDFFSARFHSHKREILIGLVDRATGARDVRAWFCALGCEIGVYQTGQGKESITKATNVSLSLLTYTQIIGSISSEIVQQSRHLEGLENILR